VRNNWSLLLWWTKLLKPKWEHLYYPFSKYMLVGKRVVDGVVPRIAGGTVIGSGEVPNYSFYGTVLNDFICGGVYIGDDVVLTAAHCVEGQTAANTKFYMGHATLNELNTVSGNTYVYNVNHITMHASYNTNTIDYDIALIFLDSNPSDDGFVPIDLVPSGQIATLEAHLRECEVVGYGITTYDDSGAVSNEMRKATVYIYSKADTPFDENYQAINPITSRMLMAGFFGNESDPAATDAITGNNRDSRPGDSGGPLFTDLSGTNYLIGLVSWGLSTSIDGYPGIYTRVSQFLTWISNNIAIYYNMTDTPLVITDDQPIIAGERGNFTVDVERGSGLLNLVAGAQHHSGMTYRYKSTRGSSRVLMHDNYIDFFISTNSRVPGNNVRYRRSVRIGRGGMRIYGRMTANSKRFQIDHPTREGYDLVHGCLEGPENGVYYRGKAQLENGKCVVELPDYFEALTLPESRTVSLTPVDGWSPLYLEGEVTNSFTVRTNLRANEGQKFHWEVKAERADTEPLVVEVPKDED